MNDDLITTGKIVAGAASVVLVNPVPGLVAAAFFEVLTNGQNKITEELIQQILARLKNIEETGILEVHELVKNESFLSLLVTASAVAARTQRKEKIARIKSATVFCISNKASVQQTDAFFNLIDDLTEEHFLVLRILAENVAAFSEVRSFGEIYRVFSKIGGSLSSDVFGHYLYDLKYRRLIRLSPKIEDEEGLVTQSVLALEQEQKGEWIIITEVAQQLLDATR